MKRIHFVLTAILFAVGLPAYAGTVTLYTDQAAFNAAAGSTSLVDFEGIVCDTCYEDHGYYSNIRGGPSVTLGGVTFTAVTGQINIGTPVGLTIVGDLAPYAASNFYSAFLGEGNGNGILADLPAGVTAFGADAGGVYGYSTTVYANWLTITVTLGSGATETDTVNMSGLAKGPTTAPVSFVGYTVTGDTIASVKFSPQTYFGIDNVQYSSASATPEPGTWLMGAAGIGLLLAGRRRRFLH